jgi:hypothetical protein
MRINRRKVIGLVAAAGVGARAVVAQAPTPPASTPRTPSSPRSPDDELQIARRQRLSDAQRVAAVKLPLTTEPAFRFRA